MPDFSLDFNFVDFDVDVGFSSAVYSGEHLLTQYVYPSLPGLKIDISRNPEFRTVVKESASGKEVRAAMRAYPRWRYQLGYEVLRTSSGLEELQKLVAFYGQVRGQFDDFLFVDPDFNAVTAQQFGVGDGVSQSFQLVRSVSGLGTTWAEPVWAPRGTPTIYVNGTPTAATIGDIGQVTFASPPALGAILTWTGDYAMRVRFTQDVMEFKRVVMSLWSAGKVELLSVLP